MILISGSLAYDLIMDFPGRFSDHILADKIHILNVSFLVEKLHKGFGGTAGNIAYTLSLLGISCQLLGVVGKDFTPYREFLVKNRIGVSYLKILPKLFTSTAFGITDIKDNQIWGFYEGADSYSDKLSIMEIKEKIDLAIISPNNPRSMLKFARQYREANIPYLFDPGMQLRYLDGKDLRKAFAGAKIIIGNDYEIAVIEKKTAINNLHDLSKSGKIIITTLGSKGSIITSQGETYQIPSAKVKNSQDPAGAGDAYRAGYVAGFVRHLPVEVCGRMGSVAASYTVEKYGTTTHRFSLKEFTRRYQENFHDKLSL